MSSLRIFVSCLILGTGIASSAAAQEPNGYPITDVNLRAGPGTEYPVILTVPADAPITILGCVPDYTWCDSVFEDQRGWMRSIYLSGYSDGDYYLLRDYAPDLGYRRVTFNIDAYWDSYYRDEPFYGDRGRWARPREAGWVNEAVFYDRLSPHGSWTWIQGRYVWVPGGVDRSWRPYTRGRWVYTDRGWTWVSNEPFGWATYHYGRWGFSDRVGWFWVPGNQWAPAWVSWRQSDDYLAWAPLPPYYDSGYDRSGGGISINISFGDVPDYYWSMVPSRDFLSDDLPRYYVSDRDRRRSAFERTRPLGHTTIVNKTVVNNVVNVNYVEQKTETKVIERQIATTDNAEQAGKVEGDTLEIYEPKPDETSETAAPPEPKDVEEVAKASETKAQAEGEATTEDQLAPKEVQEAIKERKGKGRKKADAKSGAEIESETKGEAALPEGDLADTRPPSKDKAKEKPVPAHEVAAPDTEAKEPAEEKDAEPKTAEPEKSAEPEKKAEPEKPDTTKTEPGDKETPAPSEDEQKGKKEKQAPEAEKSAPKDAGKDKAERPAKQDAAPADKAPEPAAPKDETPPKPKQATTPKEEKPTEAEEPKPSAEPKGEEPKGKEPAAEEKPEVQKPEPKEPEAKKAEPEEPKAKKPDVQKPEPKAPEKAKPEPKKPEAKKTAPKPEAKKPGPKPEAKEPAPKPEAKEPAPKPEANEPAPQPEAKKPAPKPEAKKPAPKPEAKKPEPKPQAQKPAPKPQAKKPAPQKREARTPERKSPPAAKREAKGAPGKAKPTGRTAQGPAPEAKGPAKSKKGPEKKPEKD